jgi:class 3 adenylate cyclase
MIPGAKPRAILTMLGLHDGLVVSAETLIELLWGEDPPRTAAKALQTHISSLRRTLGDGFVLTEGTGWTLAQSDVDASRYKSAARLGCDAAATGDTSQAVTCFEQALVLWRGTPELPDGRRGTSEKTRWIEDHAALVEDRADALLATGRAAEIIGELEAAVAEAPLRERRWGQLMLALYRAGRQGEALGAYQRARALLADELGVDPGPDLRRLEAAIVAQHTALEIPAAQDLPAMTRALTFLLTDIEGSTAAWEADADAMAVALARHDELVEQVVTSRGGRLIKTRGEGDATFSVFERPSAAAAAAIELQEAIGHEPWSLREPMRIRVALHTGEVELRDGDYFGRAVNRAARLRSLAVGGQILCSGATAELVIDSLRDDVVLTDLGMRQLRNLARPEHVFELRMETADDHERAVSTDAPRERPSLPAVLAGPGPFVGRARELERLFSTWQAALAGGTNAVLIAGEPGVGKTRLAGEWSRQAYDQGALVIYGRCDEDLGAPYQPFAEALRSLVPCLGSSAIRGLRGVEALLPLVPGLADVLPDLAAPARADPDTERYALFDAVVALLGIASASAPVVLILDDLHWAAKPTLLLLRHLLRFGEQARVQIVGTYRGTDLDRSHPLAAMLADLHRDGTADRIQLTGLDENDVTAYVAEAGYDDEELARALASVTGGNPFFLIEALRHVDESGGRWDQSTLPQGVREAVSRRLSRLPAETNKALAAAAVVGSRFALDLVERVVEADLVDAFDEACKAGIVIEEPGGRYRFNHALVRQSLLAELPSVRRMRLHQRIATTLETQPGADDELLAELAHHYFECAWAGNAAKAVEYCRRAADQAMARLAYEGAADLYGQALHALDEIDDELPDRNEQAAELLIARCEALLAAGDVASAAGAVSQLQDASVNSARLAAWATCFDGQLSMLIHPERLDEIETALGTAAQQLAELDDAAGEANAHTVRAACLARLGRIGDAEIALDDALTAARRAHEHRRVNAVLAGAPLAALWGPNPVPRAGGRCLDVVRLLRITTDSPAVEATSTRCQAVLEAFRGRAAAARRMIDSARRTVTELGLRHALLEVEQFAGIVELVADDPGAAESHLRQAYNGFRRMGLDADTAETAALLGRTCLALNRDAEADELCTESERLAGHALKPSIAWRALRALLLSRGNDHDEARGVAAAAVRLAERTDALVDHGDACLTLATVLGAAGDVAGARAAAERAADLYARKGAAALAERAGRVLGERDVPTAPAPPAPPTVEPDTACVRVGKRALDAAARGAWDEFEQLFAPEVSVESRRKIVGFTQIDVQSGEWAHENRRILETDGIRPSQVVIAVRGDRLALTRLKLGTADMSPGAPRDELLQLYGIDVEGRIALHMFFDIDDLDTALAELDAAHARFEEERSQARRLENNAARVIARGYSYFAARDWDAIAQNLADNYSIDDRRRMANAGIRHGRDAGTKVLRATADVGFTTMMMLGAAATRGERLVLTRVRVSGRDPAAIQNDALNVVEIDADEKVAAVVVFDLDDFDAAIAELDARYIGGEAAAHARTWSVITGAYAALNRRDHPATTPDWVNIDHRRGISFAPGDVSALLANWNATPDLSNSIEAVHRLNDLGAVVTSVTHETSQEGFEAEYRGISVLTIDRDLIDRLEVFDEADLGGALVRFDELSRPARRLENAASQAVERMWTNFAARDWTAISEIGAQNFSVDDRRRVVNAGIRHGRDAAMQDLLAVADVGFTITAAEVIATRGERLVLTRVRAADRDTEENQNDALNIHEIDTGERITAAVVFDLDDIDAAFQELDARYLAGDAAAHAHTWSVITQGYAAFNRREVPAVDWVTIDYRQATPFEPSNMTPSVRTIWDLTPDLSIHIEAVHRLNNSGAVITHKGHGTSQEGFDAEWRAIDLLTVEGDRIGRCEVFDEADLDAAIARFDQLSRPVRRLENAASQAYERIYAHFAVRDWETIREMMADAFSLDDRRRVVNGGVRHGRDVAIEDLKAVADIGFTLTMVGVMAVRGARLALIRSRGSGPDPEAIQDDAPIVIEIDADGRFAAVVAFDLDDFYAAIAELDARYLAGEAAPYARTWSVVAGAYAALNRHELAATTQDLVNIDHRRGAAYAPGDLIPYIRAGWDLGQDINTYIEAVHQLDDLGAVVTHAAHGTSKEGFNAEWAGVQILTVEGETINRSELFDEADVDAALARFEELHPQAPRLENAASQVEARFWRSYGTRDWDGMAELSADHIYTDDRRSVVNSGVRHGRDNQLADMRSLADFEANITATVIAIRGERLVLTRVCSSNRNLRHGEWDTQWLVLAEIGADELFSAHVVFDADDIDAAFDELDARYIAGEAAAHAHTWFVIARECAAFNRHEITGADGVSIVDHRRGALFTSSNMSAYIGASRDLTPDLRIDIEAVHRLSSFGAVVTYSAHETSPEGFDAEWRMTQLLIVDGDRISGVEIFDEADLDAALARFEELQPPKPRLENAATRVNDRFQGQYAARNWEAIAEMLDDDFVQDDRRRVVGAGVRNGRDAQMADLRAIADVWVTNITPTVIATRGERLFLMRAGYSAGSHGSEASRTETFVVVEINADERIVASISFDLNDLDAAFAELNARYLAGEAAAHADTWSVVAEALAGFTRREPPATMPDAVFVDHRPLVTTEAVDLAASLRAMWDLISDVSIYIEAVHRLDDFGAVITQTVNLTSQEGFDAEWRMINDFTIERGLISRTEVFDEADLDAALVRFDELSRPMPRLENAASQVIERFRACFASRDWDALSGILADGVTTEDRRRVVNGGLREGRDAVIAEISALADVGTKSIASHIIAIRGERLVLTRTRSSGRDARPEAFHTEVLNIVEIDADNHITATVNFDLDDIDAAFAELDARYLAGEAAAHSHTWSVIVGIYAAFNRHQLAAATPDYVVIDHRLQAMIKAGDLEAYVRAAWDLAPSLNNYIETVHRLSDLGAVVTNVACGTSQDGFDAEWRMIHLFTIEGDLTSRCEIFDEADLDAALARFDELRTQAPRLENAATRVSERMDAYFAARDWNAMTKILADGHYFDDRRRVVGSGVRHGRDAIAEMRAGADLGATIVTSTVIATRGERLALRRARYSGRDPRPEAFHTELLNIVEIDADERIVASVAFDLNEIDAAFEQLDARYLAGEAAPHAHTWSTIIGSYAAFNRHELSAADWVTVDHRPVVAIGAGDLPATIRAIWDLTPELSIHVEAVHRLGSFGAVVTDTVFGTSSEGFDAEWRMIQLLSVEGDRISRCEVFDEADLDAALARFEELKPQAPRLENTASQVEQRFSVCFAARDWAAMAELLSDDTLMDDRRHVVNAGIRHGRDAEIASQRAVADVGVTNMTPTVVAIRGGRLTLGCYSIADGWSGSKVLCVSEVNAENQIVARVVFDSDDIDAAFEELDARYLAGEAAAHAHTWSVIMGSLAAFSRHEFPPTAPDSVYIDHQPLVRVESVDLAASLRDTWVVTPDVSVCVEAVHRLSELGAVVTQTLKGTSPEGFDAEWRMINICTVEGELINRAEMFDEADLDAALARFDELSADTSGRTPGEE